MDGLIYSDVCWLWWTNGHRRTHQPNQLLGGGGGVDVNIAGPRRGNSNNGSSGHQELNVGKGTKKKKNIHIKFKKKQKHNQNRY